MAKGAGYVRGIFNRATSRGLSVSRGGGRMTINWGDRRVTYSTSTGRVLRIQRPRTYEGSVVNFTVYD